ncbi:IclR family transcriptional regulator [Actinoplanes sp. NPDC049316]|uniref:IclR family transcriptional regulator n=1 Tax=Actinoplanes sp. NPDC049316 TaxID=3154727 RepID=UPI003431265B
MSNGRTERSPALVQSVDRAVTVLEILARRGDAGVTEIAVELGVHKSTASRLVGALESRGLVEQVSGRGKYRLGLGMVRLAGAAAARIDLPEAAGPVCARVAEELGETVNVAVLDGDRSVNISQALGRAAVSSYNWVGRQTPSHATSSGKVLLAYAGADARRAALARPLDAYTPYTITDPVVLRRQLAEAERAGWASTAEELEIGLHAVAAPIRGAGGRVVAAISVSGPSYRLPVSAFAELAAQLKAAAAEIGRGLGHSG